MTDYNLIVSIDGDRDGTALYRSCGSLQDAIRAACKWMDINGNLEDGLLRISIEVVSKDVTRYTVSEIRKIIEEKGALF